MKPLVKQSNDTSYDRTLCILAIEWYISPKICSDHFGVELTLLKIALVAVK